MQYSSALVMALATAVSATNFKVSVGDGKLVYSPNDLTAVVGDTVEFSFFPANHTVTQSSFADPCHPLAGGFFSGFVPTTPQTLGATFTITVKDTKPIWFYCSQTGAGGHCQKGMVGSINAPKTGNTLAAFTKLAGNATTSTFPGGAFSPVGGTFVAAAKNSNSTSTNGTSTSTSSGSGSGSTSTAGSGSGSGSSSLSSFTSVYSTTYATSATVTTEISSTYTSGGQVYTTAVPSTYTTAYTTAAATTATGVATVSAGAAAGGLSANIVGMGAVVLGALAMV